MLPEAAAIDVGCALGYLFPIIVCDVFGGAAVFVSVGMKEFRQFAG